MGIRVVQVVPNEVPLSDIVKSEGASHGAVLKGTEVVALCENHDEAALKTPISKPSSQKGLASSSDFPPT